MVFPTPVVFGFTDEMQLRQVIVKAINSMATLKSDLTIYNNRNIHFPLTTFFPERVERVLRNIIFCSFRPTSVTLSQFKADKTEMSFAP